MLSRLSDSTQGWRSFYFKHRLYISALEQARVLILGKYFVHQYVVSSLLHLNVAMFSQKHFSSYLREI